jgi:hypothetical protein
VHIFVIGCFDLGGWKGLRVGIQVTMHLEPCVDEKWWNHISLLRVLQVDPDYSLMSTASGIIEESF